MTRCDDCGGPIPPEDVALCTVPSVPCGHADCEGPAREDCACAEPEIVCAECHVEALRDARLDRMQGGRP